MTPLSPPRILYGPPIKDLPVPVADLFGKAIDELLNLSLSVKIRPHKEALVDQLIELATVACKQIEVLWEDSKYRPLVEASAHERHYFPLLHTNLKTTPFSCGDEIKKTIRLARIPGNEKGKKGRRIKTDLMNSEIEKFVFGVISPGSLRIQTISLETAGSYEGAHQVRSEEVDLVKPETRQRLLSEDGRKELGRWSEAFVDEYVRPHRPDLLSDDGKTGAFSEKVQDYIANIQKKNFDEKNRNSEPWRFLRMLVRKRIRKFRTQIAGPNPQIR